MQLQFSSPDRKSWLATLDAFWQSETPRSVCSTIGLSVRETPVQNWLLAGVCQHQDTCTDVTLLQFFSSCTSLRISQFLSTDRNSQATEIANSTQLSNSSCEMACVQSSEGRSWILRGLIRTEARFKFATFCLVEPWMRLHWAKLTAKFCKSVLCWLLSDILCGGKPRPHGRKEVFWYLSLD